MKKTAFISLLLALVLCIGTAAAEETGNNILGKPFPDFTVTH